MLYDPYGSVIRDARRPLRRATSRTASADARDHVVRVDHRSGPAAADEAVVMRDEPHAA